MTKSMKMPVAAQEIITTEMTKNKAYIIGNGITRRGFDLEILKNETTFGCNAIHREFSPSYVIAIDPGPTEELRHQDKYPQHRIIIPPYNEQFELEGFRSEKRMRSNAGMNCIIEADRRGFDELFCIGFDFLVDKEEFAIGNMFDGTEHYGPEKRATVFENKDRVKYIQWYISKNYNVQFNFVWPRQELDLFDLIGPNIKGMFYDQLEIEHE